MTTRFAISIGDTNRRKPTDSENQHKTVLTMMEACKNLGESKPNQITSGLTVNASEADIANSIICGFSYPALLCSAGYILKYLSPVLVEYMKSRSQKEITVDFSGKRITVKGGGDFEKNLTDIIEAIEKNND
jgi:hypothetical protein